MQIVIDIPEELYDRLIIKGKDISEEETSTILDIIADGIILPKGHGRLIDADKIILEATERMKYPANHKYMECVIAHMKLAPSIIEADRE